MMGRLQMLTWILKIAILLLSLQAQATSEIFYSYYNENPATSIQSGAVKRPLLLWIHGCRQSAREFVDVTDVIEKTKHLNPLIIAPYQKSKMNVLKCWNFASNEMQKRDGDFMQVVQEIQRHIQSGEVDANRIYVGGFSSGAIFANRLAQCFPDIFKGALIHSGAPFSLRKGAEEALQCGAETEIKRLKTLFYIHGEKDKVVPTFFGRKAFEQSVLYMDYLDDRTPNASYEVARLEDGVGYRISYKDGSLTQFIEIKDMSHRWSGSKPGSDFSSPETVSSIDLFLQVTRQLQ